MSMCTEGQFISAVYYLELKDLANRNVTRSQDFQKQTALVLCFGIYYLKCLRRYLVFRLCSVPAI